MNDDQIFMLQALEEAKKAFTAGEVPIGAVLVLEGKVIARAHNSMEKLQDATAHAELLAIRKASLLIGNWRLLESTLYTTLEPCAMCAGALMLSRVKRLVWGAPDLRHGANGSWVNLFDKNHPTHTLEVTSGLLEAECRDLMVQFFKEKRNGCSAV